MIKILAIIRYIPSTFAVLMPYTVKNYNTIYSIKYCKNDRKMTILGCNSEIQQNTVNFMSNFPGL